jgi:hypothetical protein
VARSIMMLLLVSACLPKKQQAPAAQPTWVRHELQTEHIHKCLDADGDGELSAAERAEMRTEFFEKMKHCKTAETAAVDAQTQDDVEPARE